MKNPQQQKTFQQLWKYSEFAAMEIKVDSVQHPKLIL